MTGWLPPKHYWVTASVLVMLGLSGCGTNRKTPPELFDVVRDQVASGEYLKAAEAYITAGAFISYDLRRVVDQTAHNGPKSDILDLVNSMSRADKNKLLAAMDKIRENPVRIRELLESAGIPNYYPEYMVSRGMDAENSQSDPLRGLRPGFDPEVEWKEVVAAMR